MANKLYVLKEELSQEAYETKVKYLYTSELNRTCVNYVDCLCGEFLYLSHNHGILNPNESIKPYKVTLLRDRKKRMWSLLTAECIHRFCKAKDIDTIVLMFSGSFYNDLEDNLQNQGYTIESPMRYFKTSKMKVKWLLNELKYNVCKLVDDSDVTDI